MRQSVAVRVCSAREDECNFAPTDRARVFWRVPAARRMKCGMEIQGGDSSV